MDLYFTEGGDLTDREVLVQAAADCGLDAEPGARSGLPSDEDVERSSARPNPPRRPASTACRASSSAACWPCQGAQSPEHLAQAIERAADEFAKRVAAE